MKNQLSNVKKKTFLNLINKSRINNLIHCNSRIKLVNNLVLSQFDFCNSLYFALPNEDLRYLQSIINSVTRVIEWMPRLSRGRITGSPEELSPQHYHL